MSLMIKHRKLTYSRAYCCLPSLPLLLKSALEGGTGIRKSKILSVFQMRSADVLAFVYVYQHFQFSEPCGEEWENKKKLSLVSCTKLSQSGAGKVHGQIPFSLNSREANKHAMLQSFDLKMSLVSIKICLKFLLFSSARLLLSFLCGECIMPRFCNCSFVLKSHIDTMNVFTKLHFRILLGSLFFGRTELPAKVLLLAILYA